MLTFSPLYRRRRSTGGSVHPETKTKQPLLLQLFQALGAASVHPDSRTVIPVPPEPICKQDGQTKNDCERNAARRWLGSYRKDHPHLKTIITEDALSPNAPLIRDILAAREISSSVSSSEMIYRLILVHQGKDTHPILVGTVERCAHPTPHEDLM